MHYVFISKYRYEALYAKMLPESMLGETFLERYADHNDSVTVIDHKRSYGVRANARHPIYENFRVKVSNSFWQHCGIESVSWVYDFVVYLAYKLFLCLEIA